MSEPEQILPVRANRVVSMRELARSAAALVDEIELNGSVFAIGRRGRMVALLTPLSERTIVEFAGPGMGEAIEAEPEVEIFPEWLEMGTVANDILLRALETYPRTFSIEGLGHEAGELAISFSRLELAGLTDRTITGGRKLTPEGLATARLLASRLDSREQPPPS